MPPTYTQVLEALRADLERLEAKIDALAAAPPGPAPAPAPPTPAPPLPPPPAPPAPNLPGSDLIRVAHEHRLENARANATTVAPADSRWRQAHINHFGGGNPRAGEFYDRIRGDETGTTAFLILRAAQAFSIPPLQALAQVWKESSFRTSQEGDNHRGGVTPWGTYPDGFQSFGPLQTKRLDFPDSFPKVRESTFYGLMYGFSVMTTLYAGASWHGSRTQGSWDRCLQSYYWGDVGSPEGIRYQEDVRRLEREQPWRALEPRG